MGSVALLLAALEETTAFLKDHHKPALNDAHPAQPCVYCDRIEANEALIDYPKAYVSIRG